MVKDFVKRIGNEKHIFIFDSISNNVFQKIDIRNDDIGIIYDAFIAEWNKRHEKQQPILHDTFTDKLNEFVVYNNERLLNMLISFIINQQHTILT